MEDDYNMEAHGDLIANPNRAGKCEISLASLATRSSYS